MVEFQTFDNIAVLAIIALGFIFFILASFAFKSIDSPCPRGIIRNGWTVIQVIGACMVTAGISFFICTLFGGKCYSNIRNVRTAEIYFGGFLVFGLVTLGMASSMINEYKEIGEKPEDKYCDNANKTNKKYLNVIIVLCSIMVVFSIGMLIWLKKTKKIEEKIE